KTIGIVSTVPLAPVALPAIAAVCEQQQPRLVRVEYTAYIHNTGRHQAQPLRDDNRKAVILSGTKDPAQSEVEAGTLPALSYRYRLEKRSQQSQQFTVETPERLYTGLEITLAGQHQLENATAALATLDMLRQQGIVWDEQALREGLRNTRWPARIDVVGHNPTIIVDGAHNADSMEKL